MAGWSGYPYESLISSITSTELRKIIFPVSYVRDWRLFSREMNVWASADELLCELVARLGRTGYHHTLEVELRLIEAERGFSEHDVDLAKVLPEFRERGIVTITNFVCDRKTFFSIL